MPTYVGPVIWPPREELDEIQDWWPSRLALRDKKALSCVDVLAVAGAGVSCATEVSES